MPNYFFTSDTHYGHAKVIQYSKRPFTDVGHMESELIDRWNAVVKPGDFVYHLGDFAFLRGPIATRIAGALNGRKFLVWGNHDKKLRLNKPFMAQWGWCEDQTAIKVGDQKIILNHYPLLTWEKAHYGSWMLHGHCHGTLFKDPYARRVDVGVDVWGYTPVSFDQLAEVMAKKEFRPVDRHGADDHE